MRAGTRRGRRRVLFQQGLLGRLHYPVRLAPLPRPLPAALRFPMLLFVAGPVLAMQFVVIPFEERRMLQVFGHAYEDYRRCVRRRL